MEKYVLDYSETSYFKGLRILYPYIQEGLLYAQQNNIKDKSQIKKIGDINEINKRNF